jgi:hypothetical protein
MSDPGPSTTDVWLARGLLVGGLWFAGTGLVDLVRALPAEWDRLLVHLPGIGAGLFFLVIHRPMSERDRAPAPEGREKAPAPEGRDPAEARLWLMTLVRLLGIGVVLSGMWVAGQSRGDDILLAAGLLVMAAGALLSLFAPRALARRWKE